tara:strand:- start:41 stop:397 length:357 start_codon:yes stop_codon:yes gene_type:complete
MGYDVVLEDPGTDEPVQVAPHMEGSNVLIPDGQTCADITVTYNYWPFFRETLHEEKGLYILDNMSARDSLVPLAQAVAKLGIDVDDNYWKPTRGNAGHILSIMLTWACRNLNAVWKIN